MRLVLTLLILVVCQLTIASDIFVQSDEIPPGFEHLNKVQENLIDVYFEGKLLGQFFARYQDEDITFLNPKRLVKKLQQLKPSFDSVVTEALANKLDANRQLIVANKKIPFKSIPVVKTVAVVFDSDKFRADLFINPEYLLAKKKISDLPASSAGFTWVNKFDAVISGSKLRDTQNQMALNLSNVGAFALGQGRLNYQLSYADNKLFENSEDISESSLQFQQINAQYDRKLTSYRFGYISTQGNLFLRDEDIFGASAGTNQQLLGRDSGIFGTPISLLLDSPSQVAIFSDGRLLSSQDYSSGLQSISTASLPNGAYPIVIRITDQAGNVTEEQQFFVKTSDIAPMGYPLYHVSAGYLTSNDFSGGLFQDISSIPVASGFYSFRLSKALGASLNVLGGDGGVYGSLGVYLLGTFYELEPQFLLGADGDYGYGLIGQITAGKIFSSFSVSHVNGESDQTLNNFKYDFDQFLSSRTQANFNLSSSFGRFSTSFQANYSKQENRSAIYSFGPSVRLTLNKVSNVTPSLSLSMQHSNDGNSYFADLRLFFNSKSWSNTTEFGYQNGRDTGFDFSNRVQWQNFDNANEGLTLGVAYSRSVKKISTARLTGDYLGGVVNLRGSVDKTFNDTQAVRYNLRAATKALVTKKGVAVSAGRDNDAGVVVDIASSVSGKEFEVRSSSGRVLKIVKTNKPTIVFLPSYQEYYLTIKNDSDLNFAYTNRPKQVVLYPGNFDVLTWEVEPSYSLVTRINQPDGKPLKQAVVKLGDMYYRTDEYGYFQADLSATDKLLKFVYGDNKHCVVTLPKIDYTQAYAVLDDLVCR